GGSLAGDGEMSIECHGGSPKKVEDSSLGEWHRLSACEFSSAATLLASGFCGDFREPDARSVAADLNIVWRGSAIFTEPCESRAGSLCHFFICRRTRRRAANCDGGARRA